jgi:hypothetical protein
MGVFSENTVVSYLASHEIVGIDESIMLAEFEDFLPLSAHRSESFAFISRNSSVSEVIVQFRDSLRERKRLGAVFITSTGKPTGELLGLITPWDVAGADPSNWEA